MPGPFTVTVTYDEAMDTGIAPTIGFSPSVASTLAFTGGVWSGGGTVYTASYTISDAGVAVPSVDVSASGAQDLVGNTQVTSNATDAFDIDTANPTVTINQALRQADPTNVAAIKFTVQFSEAVTDFDDLSDVTLTGTAAATVTSITSLGGNAYEVLVTATTNGTVIANVTPA